MAAVLKSSGFYRRSVKKREDLLVEGFVEPSEEEVEKALDGGIR